MKVSITLEVEAETVTAAVGSILYAIESECSTEGLKVLEVNASPAYSADSTIESTTTVHNHITNCEHTPDAISLEGQAEIAKARAMPATLS